MRSSALPCFLVLPALLAADLQTRAGTFGLDTGYPGALPGRAKILCQSTNLVIENRSLTLSWAISRPGLAGWSVTDKLLGRSISFTGELFQITLENGQIYRASELIPTDTPHVSRLRPDPDAAQLAKRIAGWQVELPLRTADGQLAVRWRTLVRENANYVRQEIDLQALGAGCTIQAIIWLDDVIPDAEASGSVEGSPWTAGNFFFGPEDPHTPLLAGVAAGGGTASNAATDPPVRRVSFHLRRGTPLRQGETLRQSFVLGTSPTGQMRRAFLYYLERERAHPYRPFLHYNSWYDIAWQPFALNETNCLDAIRIFGERFIQPHGVVMDAMVFDDGWDNPKTLWQFHAGFPRGFTPLAALCDQYHTRLGVWLSPFGGYGESRNQRLAFGARQGFETNGTGFSLAGPKYYGAFQQACLEMIRRYRVNHFKFDGIANGMYANGSAGYVQDTEAMRRLMLDLRDADPNLYINLTTGSWPSPFWLRYADSLWRQGDDMGFAGKGSKQQQWLTYRDQETYRNIVGKGRLYPLNALMTQGVAYSRNGHAGNPSFDFAGFKADVRSFFGSGTSLQELYIQPGKLTADDWAVLAEAAKWSRANADALVDTHWIGGDPAKLQVYGYASWNNGKAILMLRNPDTQPQDYILQPGKALEIPGEQPAELVFRSPWREDAQKPPLRTSQAADVRLTLQPLEILILEASTETPAKP